MYETRNKVRQSSGKTKLLIPFFYGRFYAGVYEGNPAVFNTLFCFFSALEKKSSEEQIESPYQNYRRGKYVLYKTLLYIVVTLGRYFHLTIMFPIWYWNLVNFPKFLCRWDIIKKPEAFWHFFCCDFYSEVRFSKTVVNAKINVT